MRRSALLHLLLCLLAAGVRGEVPCMAKTQVPKIAFLFTARAGMPLEQVWGPWFASVAGLIPTQAVSERICSAGQQRDPSFIPQALACAPDPETPILQRQGLFTVYIHSSRVNFTDFDGGSIFQGTLLPQSTATSWGDTIEAMRALLRAALADPLNQRFLTLSDSDVPLYPATLTYLQLMQESKSRLAACTRFDLVNINRYTCAMSEHGVETHHWRKGAQWLSLLRSHAQAIVEDEVVRTVFLEHCSGVMDDIPLGRHRGCLVDEHYYHTLIAVRGLERQTDCKGNLAVADFDNSFEGHPRLYLAEDVIPELLVSLRQPIWWLGQAECAIEATWADAKRGFMRLPISPEVLDCGEVRAAATMRPMESWCQLFARKFHGSAAAPLAAIFGSHNASQHLDLFEAL